MKPNVSYCGLNCDGCPIHWATLETDSGKQNKMRAAIANICNEKYQQNLNGNDITDCDGCLTVERLFPACKKFAPVPEPNNSPLAPIVRITPVPHFIIFFKRNPMPKYCWMSSERH